MVESYDLKTSQEVIVAPNVAHERWVDTAKALIFGGMATAQGALGTAYLALAERIQEATPTIGQVSEVLKDLGFTISPESIETFKAALETTLAPQVQLHEAAAVVSFVAAACLYGASTISAIKASRNG